VSQCFDPRYHSVSIPVFRCRRTCDSRSAPPWGETSSSAVAAVGIRGGEGVGAMLLDTWGRRCMTVRASARRWRHGAGAPNPERRTSAAARSRSPPCRRRSKRPSTSALARAKHDRPRLSAAATSEHDRGLQLWVSPFDGDEQVKRQGALISRLPTMPCSIPTSRILSGLQVSSSRSAARRRAAGYSPNDARPRRSSSSRRRSSSSSRACASRHTVPEDQYVGPAGIDAVVEVPACLQQQASDLRPAALSSTESHEALFRVMGCHRPRRSETRRRALPG
jgi:hypothetical protein